jgi:hypothetical protein
MQEVWEFVRLRVRRCAIVWSAVAVWVVPAVTIAQQPPGPPVVPTHRLPVIVLAQPPEGATLPQDRPIVMFRFAAGEPNDPIDLASFAVTVDGVDRTSLFQVTAGEAWGPLVSADTVAAARLHQLTARICSARGACAFATTAVSVVPSATSQPAAGGAAADSSSSASSRRRRVIDVILEALKKLLSP